MKIKYLVPALSVVFLATISMNPVFAAVNQNVKAPTTSSIWNALAPSHWLILYQINIVTVIKSGCQ